jgi:5'-methylthioadenosine phosphorylase
MAVLGVLGGSGLYDLPGLTGVEERAFDTPFGPPSSPIITGTLGQTNLAFIARHGKGHTLSPSNVPYRANVYALRSIGVTHVLSVSAVGSLQTELPPKTAVIPDQIIDRTVSRSRTFFDNGVVAHVGMADPFCDSFRSDVYRHATDIRGNVAFGGTYVCIEGPQFSTRAESNLYRSWDASIIGMTAMPEARLAREAGLCYATLAMVTDYDVWHESEQDVTVEMVQRVLAENVETGREVIRRLAWAGVPACECGCSMALDGAIITSPEHLSAEAAALVASFRQ